MKDKTTNNYEMAWFFCSDLLNQDHVKDKRFASQFIDAHAMVSNINLAKVINLLLSVLIFLIRAWRRKTTLHSETNWHAK